MRVRFLLDAALRNPETNRYRKLRAGRSYELPDESATRFVERGAAVVADADADADADAQIETESEETDKPDDED